MYKGHIDAFHQELSLYLIVTLLILSNTDN